MINLKKVYITLSLVLLLMFGVMLVACNNVTNKEEKILTDIKIDYSGKMNYFVGEAFDNGSLTVFAVYNNGEELDVTSSSQVSGSTETAGSTVKITISYGGFIKYLEIKVVDKTLTQLEVGLKDEAREFCDGQTINKEDLVVTAKFDDQTSQIITDYSISNTYLNSPFTTITVAYQEKSAAIDINVHAVTFVAQVEPSLYQTGIKAHYICDVSGKLLNSEEGRLEITLEELVIPVKSVRAVDVKLVDPQNKYFEGDSVSKDDIIVTVICEDNSEYTIDDYSIISSILTIDNPIVTVEFRGVKGSVNVPMHSIVYIEEVESTLVKHGKLAHYEDEDSGKIYNLQMEEIDEKDLIIPLMKGLSVTSEEMTAKNIKGANAGTKTENGVLLISPDKSNSKTGKIIITYSLTVDNATDAKFYLNVNTRNVLNKIKDVFSVKVNGQVFEIDEGATLPYASDNAWLQHSYALVGKISLLEGDNVIEITRLNLSMLSNVGAYTYNFFGIGITSYKETAITPFIPEEEIIEPEVIPNLIEFGVMHETVTLRDKDGEAVNKNAKESNVSANDSSAKKGLITMSYNIYSEAATTVKLYIRTSSQCKENTIAESYSFQVGGEDVQISDSAFMPYNDFDRWNDIRYTFVAEINLTQGNNLIVITRPDLNEREQNNFVGYNFFGIGLSVPDGATLGWAV